MKAQDIPIPITINVDRFAETGQARIMTTREYRRPACPMSRRPGVLLAVPPRDILHQKNALRSPSTCGKQEVHARQPSGFPESRMSEWTPRVEKTMNNV